MEVNELWRKTRSWLVDLVFLVPAIALAVCYLLQPQRGAALQSISATLRTVAQPRSGPRVWAAPPDLTHFEGDGLARIGGEIEFLGCDAAITQDQHGTRVWLLTLWRGCRPISTDYYLVMELVPEHGGTPIRVEHFLGQQFVGSELRTSRWPAGQVVIDAIALPVGVDPRVGYHQRIKVRGVSENAWREVDSPFLQQDAEGWLAICR